ncbi:hypothetical protein GTP38_23335 [Duganella sp. FT94W]|uniref:GYF domain-containing protein n=1 Tax=Duganella lactea TaxID=2692173 RepID=A0ABW9VCA0_9BURK|nr:hypothetical protein [Duganella lactea]MYM37264.1 hypothetical protein [Duganella lactea]
MALYVRHCAWLDAIPEREGKDGLPANQVSRRKAMTASGSPIEMPPLECGEYLLGYLYDVGPVVPAGMGSGPVTYAEIEAWQRVSGISLHPWEAALIRRLSGEYAAESHAATKQNHPPPFKEGQSLRSHLKKQSDRNLDRFLA